MKRRTSSAHAFTIVELMVVISVVSLLLALLLPAIESARNSAQAARCKSNLSQLGKAVHMYHADHDCLPPWMLDFDHELPLGRVMQPQELRSSYASIQAHLLPYLEQGELYDGLNLAKQRVSPDQLPPALGSHHGTARRVQIGVCLCPSDGQAKRMPGAISYRGNYGVGPAGHRTFEFPDSANGFFASVALGTKSPVTFDLVYDGLGRTAMFSERLVGSQDSANWNARRDMHALGPNPTTADQTLQLCAAVDRFPGTGVYAFAGRSWLLTGLHHTLYTHTLPPNSAIGDCMKLNALTGWGASSARSNHAGAVNVCFGDGSVRAVNDAVDLDIWRALGSRNGGETVLNSSY